MTTPIERSYGLSEDFMILAKAWNPDAERIIFNGIWRGFEILQANDAFQISRKDEQVEVDISWTAHCKIYDYLHDQELTTHLQVLSNPPESKKRRKKGQPPSSDIGIRLVAGRVNSFLSLEAKIIPTDKNVTKYITEIKKNFLSGRYAYSSSVGGMLGYLMEGSADNAFATISSKLRQSLIHYEEFPARAHKISHHIKTLDGGEKMHFKCHHLIIKFQYID